MSWLSKIGGQISGGAQGLAKQFGNPGHTNWKPDPTQYQGAWNNSADPFATGGLAQAGQAAQGQNAPGVAGAQQGQSALAGLLMGQANGTAPSLAGAQLRAGQQTNAANTMALQAQARGVNPSMAAYNAGQINSQANQATNMQAAQAGLAERNMAQGQLGGVLSSQGQLGLGQQAQRNQLTEYYVSQGMSQEQAQLQANIAMQQISAGVATGNAANSANLIGGLLGGAATAGGAAIAALSGGGMVPSDGLSPMDGGLVQALRAHGGMIPGQDPGRDTVTDGRIGLRPGEVVVNPENPEYERARAAVGAVDGRRIAALACGGSVPGYAGGGTIDPAAIQQQLQAGDFSAFPDPTTTDPAINPMFLPSPNAAPGMDLGFPGAPPSYNVPNNGAAQPPAPSAVPRDTGWDAVDRAIPNTAATMAAPAGAGTVSPRLTKNLDQAIATQGQHDAAALDAKGQAIGDQGTALATLGAAPPQTPIDPRAFYAHIGATLGAKSPTGQRIVGGIAAGLMEGLGQVGAALSHQENGAAKIIQGAIQDSIAAQNQNGQLSRQQWLDQVQYLTQASQNKIAELGAHADAQHVRDQVPILQAQVALETAKAVAARGMLQPGEADKLGPYQVAIDAGKALAAILRDPRLPHGITEGALNVTGKLPWSDPEMKRRLAEEHSAIARYQGAIAGALTMEGKDKAEVNKALEEMRINPSDRIEVQQEKLRQGFLWLGSQMSVGSATAAGHHPSQSSGGTVESAQPQ